MPNWCMTNYIFYGSEAEVNALHDKFNDWTSKEGIITNFGEAWLGNILFHAGLTERINNANNCPSRARIPCRGWVEDISDVLFSRNELNAYTFSLTTETAWGAMPEMFELVIKTLGYSIQFMFQSEECNMGVYDIYDPEGTGFFDGENAYIDMFIDDRNEAFEKYPYLNDISDVGYCNREWISEWLRRNEFSQPEDLANIELPSENDYISIHYFDYVDKWW